MTRRRPQGGVDSRAGGGQRRAQRLALLSLVVLSACVATANRPPPARASVPYDEFAGTVDTKGFMSLDEDKSGTVTAGEWRQFDRTVEARQDFEALDTDRDDEINPYEWQTNLGRSGVVLRVFHYLDVDRDHYVSSDEMRRDPVVAALFAVTF